MVIRLVMTALCAASLATAAFAAERTITSATIGTSSAQALAAPVGPRLFLAITNESSTATIACKFGGTAVLNTAGNYTIPPSSTRTWGPVSRETPLSGSAVVCISDTASTPATIESWP